MLIQKRSGAIIYPTSDGKPMAETDVHRDQIIQLILALQDYFRNRDDVYVTGNLLMLYDEGDGHKHLAPDVMVAMGVARKDRESYKLWEEGKAPDTVIEITSASTRTEDLGRKKNLYRTHGVKEYYIFDPLKEYLPAQLRGFQLVDGQYVPMDEGAALASPLLGLELHVVDEVLRLYDPSSQCLLPVHAEAMRRWREAEQRAEEARQMAEAERQRADAERLRADAERQRAESAEGRERAARQEVQQQRLLDKARRQRMARRLLAGGLERQQVLEMTELEPDDLPGDEGPQPSV